MPRLTRDFFAQPTLSVARRLIGCVLVHDQKVGGRTRRLSGIITETEAYCGETDLGCHAKAGRTNRTVVMYGPPGRALRLLHLWQSLALQLHHPPQGQPHAVLIRAIQPLEGLDLMARRRAGQPEKRWTDGPGKLTQAMGIDGRHNTLDLTAPKAIIFVQSGQAVPDKLVSKGPRIGLYTVPEPWKSKPWRFLATLPTEEKR